MNKNISIILSSVLFSSVTLAQSSLTKNMNPKIGLNTIFEYVNNSKDSDEDGFSFKEAELQFSSDIDVYLKGQATIAIHKEHHEEGEAESEEHGHASYAVEPEEVFVETLQIPSVTFKAGKFLLDIGKQNRTHSHALPFNSHAKLNDLIIGDEAVSEVGVSASYLLPTSFFNELTVEYFTASNDELFSSEDKHESSYLLRYKSLFDINSATTFDYGLTYLTQSAENKTDIYGLDFSVKWKPVTLGNYHSFAWVTDILKKKKYGTDGETEGGVSSYLRYQLSQRLFAQYKYEHLGLDSSTETNTNVHTALIAFIPSEFSSVRLQYDHINDKTEVDERVLTLQLNISMGAHPAHAY
ncbi:hypothetical protein [Bacteriovorax sp. Seq25_V]|uniref:hypothetical protein n=1 Tax=Bacteriovorax sp. Seq25_V TaxID=1201288 RepID=UPI000389E6AA|nr:hypothetical protein [Bacteriovorax sp. Seq25_V]EQC46909.1 hypothetical protein M900_2532 [Bacteriovorax sp. Seq25_V]